MLRQLIEKRTRMVERARQFLGENETSWNASKRAHYNALMADVERVDTQIDAAKRESPAPASAGTRSVVTQPRAKSVGPDSPEYRVAFMSYLRGENPDKLMRSLTTAGNAGFLVPQHMADKIVEQLLLFMPYRQYCTIISTTGSTDVPVDNADGLAYWAGEEEAYTDSDDTLANITLGAFKLTALTKVSEELLMDAAFPVTDLIARQFARRFAEKEEAAFTSGAGTTEPTGWLGAAQIGVTTAANNAFTADELIDLFYSLKAPYRSRAIWVMNDEHVKTIRKMKTLTDDYIWQPSYQAGQPELLMGRPIVVCPSLPNVAADTRVLGFGDFSYYYIAQRGPMILQRMNELYANNGQIGFRAYQRIDGALTLPEAVKVLKIKA